MANNNGLLAKRLANKQPGSNGQAPSYSTNSSVNTSTNSSKNSEENFEDDILSGIKQSQPQRREEKKQEPLYQEPKKKMTEAELEIESLRRHHEEQKRLERWKLSTRIVNISLVLACVYVLFLIYGVLVTNYQYTDNGTIKAQRLTISEIKEKKNYETIYYQYLNCRSLYEEVLLLDYRLGKGEEDPLTLAPEYESLLDEVNNLSVKTDALEVDSQYSQIKSLLLNWIQNDIALYLQNMSSAISQNNAETANNALQDKDNVYSDFSIITQNIVAMGENVKGVDIVDVKEWTPEDYVDKEINGK